MAHHKREVIDERTRKALAEKKRASHVLGKPENLVVQAVRKGMAIRQRNAREHEIKRRAAAILDEHGFVVGEVNSIRPYRYSSLIKCIIKLTG